MPPTAIIQPTTAPQTKRKTSLVVVGGTLIALFLVGLVLARLVGAKTVSTAPPSNATATELTSTTTTTKTLPSDTLLTALLATGSVLLLAGLLYSRISAIKVPGGGEIDLITAADKKQVQANVTAAIDAKRTADKDVSPAQAVLIAVDALANLVTEKRQIVEGTATSDAITRAVKTAVATHLGPSQV